MNLQLEAALELAARGWHVFPVKSGGKSPREGWKWASWNTTDPQRIAEWWHDDGNVGITCGPSGLVVIDLDVGDPPPSPWDTLPGVTDGGDVYAVIASAHDDGWPDTYTVHTPRGGWHFYFQAGDYKIRNSASRIAPMIDVRGDGGFVVGAGSVRPDGAYELVNDRDPAPLPGWLAKLAAKAKVEQPATTRPLAPVRATGRGYVRAALDAEARDVAQAKKGQRNDQLNRSAFAVARFVRDGRLGEDVMAETLMSAALDAGLDAGAARRTIGSALSGRRA